MRKLNLKPLLENKIFTFCLLAIILASCEDDEIEVRHDLENKIDLIIKSYQDFVSNEKSNIFDPPIYEVKFYEAQGECFVSINTNYFYQSNLDGYEFKNNKLVTFNNTNSVCNKGLVKIKESGKVEKLRNFKNEKEAFDNYSPGYWLFKIEDDRLISVGQGKLKIDFDKN